MPKKAMPKKMKARGVGGDIGSKLGDKAEKELMKLFNKYKSQVGLARGGMAMPAHGWGDFVNDLKNFDFNTAKKWFGLARGGGMARGGMAGMEMPAHGWGDFVNDLKNFDFNTAKKWFGLKRGGAVARGGSVFQ